MNATSRRAVTWAHLSTTRQNILCTTTKVDILLICFLYSHLRNVRVYGKPCRYSFYSAFSSPLSQPPNQLPKYCKKLQRFYTTLTPSIQYLILLSRHLQFRALIILVQTTGGYLVQA